MHPCHLVYLPEMNLTLEINFLENLEYTALLEFLKGDKRKLNMVLTKYGIRDGVLYKSENGGPFRKMTDVELTKGLLQYNTWLNRAQGTSEHSIVNNLVNIDAHNTKHYRNQRNRYKSTKEHKHLRGIEMSKVVKPGDIVRVEGTKSVNKLRVVEEVRSTGITGRHLVYNRWSKKYSKGQYITDHMWSKVVEIIPQRAIEFQS